MAKGTGVTPERTQELLLLLEQVLGLAPPPPSKPKVVMKNGAVVRDAIVKVGPDDPNYSKSNEGVVRVKRSDFVIIRMDLYEEQQRQKQEDRRQRRLLDSCRLGLYGPVDDE